MKSWIVRALNLYYFEHDFFVVSAFLIISPVICLFNFFDLIKVKNGRIIVLAYYFRLWVRVTFIDYVQNMIPYKIIKAIKLKIIMFWSFLGRMDARWRSLNGKCYLKLNLIDFFGNFLHF